MRTSPPPVGTYRVRFRVPTQTGPQNRRDLRDLRPQSDAETFAAILRRQQPPASTPPSNGWTRRRPHQRRPSRSVPGSTRTSPNSPASPPGPATTTTPSTAATSPRLDPKPLTSISRADIATFVNSMEANGLSPKTIKNTVHLLSSTLTLAVREGLLARNPVQGVKLPKQRQGVDDEEGDIFLTYEEFHRLHEATPDHYKPLVALLAGTGMRWSEATALEWKHINLEAGTIQRPPSLEETQAAAGNSAHQRRRRGGGQSTPPPWLSSRWPSRVWASPATSCSHTRRRDRPSLQLLQPHLGAVLRPRRPGEPAAQDQGHASTHASWLICDGVTCRPSRTSSATSRRRPRARCTRT